MWFKLRGIAMGEDFVQDLEVWHLFRRDCLALRGVRSFYCICIVYMENGQHTAKERVNLTGLF